MPEAPASAIHTGWSQAAVLHLTSAVGGGVDRYIRDLAGATKRAHWIWHVGSGRDVIEDVARGRFLALREGALGASEASRLATMLRSAGVGILHQHSLAPAALDALQWVERELALPRLQSLHDVSFVDPAAFAGAVDPAAFAGAVDPAAFAGAVDPKAYAAGDRDAAARAAAGDGPAPPAGSHAEADAAWRRRVAEALHGATEVIVPSAYIARLLAQHFAGVAARTLAPGLRIAPESRTAQPLRRGGAPCVPPAEFLAQAPRQVVAVVGAIGPHKGSALLAPLAAALQGSEVGLVVVGYTDERLRPGWLVPGGLYVHGPYRDDALVRWLDAYRARLVLFPNRMPESFSYTLSEVWAAGRPVVVPDEGALGERVARYGGGWRLPAGFTVEAAAALLRRLLGPAGSAEWARVESGLLEQNPERIPTLAAMAHELDELYARYARPSAGAAADAPPDLSPLLAVNFDGVRFRDELIRLVGELGTAESERDAARTWATKLERDVGELQAAVGRLFAENQRLADVEAAFAQLPGFVRRLLYRMASRGRR